MKQLRLNFSDYSAREQEADAARHAKAQNMLKVPKHVYLMKVSGEWAHFIVGQNGKDDYDFYEEMTLTAVYNKLKREKPEYTVKVIRNEGLENYLRDRRGKRKVRQLRIDFGKER